MKRLEKQPTAAVGANEQLDGLSLYSTGQMKRYYLLSWPYKARTALASFAE